MFTEADKRHLQAAIGWLELGNLTEASEELEQIRPQARAHPDVLQVRVKIYCAAGKWENVSVIANTLCGMLPESSFGPMHLAEALRQLNRPAEARNALLPVADKFPEEWQIPFELACLDSRLGNRKAALEWLERAIDVAGKKDIRQLALDHPDLARLWADIAEI